MPVPRLYLDENLDPTLARILSSRQFDVLTARDAEMLGRNDPEQLRFATRCKRCLVTQNAVDFVPLHAAFIRDGHEHSGVLLVAHNPNPSIIASKIIKRLANETAESVKSQLLFA